MFKPLVNKLPKRNMYCGFIILRFCSLVVEKADNRQMQEWAMEVKWDGINIGNGKGS